MIVRRRSVASAVATTATVAAALGGMAGCAQVKTTSTVRVLPRDGDSEVVGRPSGDVSDRAYEVAWLQRGREVIVEVHEHRRCQVQLHVPVVREEKITRKLDGTIYWEFGVLAVTGTVATWAFVDPGAFGGVLINGQGDLVENTRGGYRIAGVFTGLAAITLTAIIIDFARARDTVRYADAYRLTPGPYTTCDQPVVEKAAHDVRLRLGDVEVRGRTDESGRARLTLPGEIGFFDASSPARRAERRGQPTSDRRPAALIIDADHAVRMELRYPYPDAPVSHVGLTPAAPFEEVGPIELQGERPAGEPEVGPEPKPKTGAAPAHE